MNLAKPLLPLALLMLIGLMLWKLSFPPAQNGLPQVAKPTQYLDFYAHDLQVVTLDAKGRPIRQLQTTDLRHYVPDEHTSLEQPVLDIFHPDGSWRVVAHQGELSENSERLFLAGDVIMDRPASAEKPPIHLKTTDVTYYPQRNYAETDAAVAINSQANWVTATGMQAWMDEPPHIRFLSKARGHYVAN